MKAREVLGLQDWGHIHHVSIFLFDSPTHVLPFQGDTEAQGGELRPSGQAAPGEM